MGTNFHALCRFQSPRRGLPNDPFDDNFITKLPRTVRFWAFIPESNYYLRFMRARPDKVGLWRCPSCFSGTYSQHLDHAGLASAGPLHHPTYQSRPDYKTTERRKRKVIKWWQKKKAKIISREVSTTCWQAWRRALFPLPFCPEIKFILGLHPTTRISLKVVQKCIVPNL